MCFTGDLTCGYKETKPQNFKKMTGVEVPNSKAISSSERLTGTGKQTVVKLLKRLWQNSHFSFFITA